MKIQQLAIRLIDQVNHEALPHVGLLIEEVRLELVDVLHKEYGLSKVEIGNLLGVSSRTMTNLAGRSRDLLIEVRKERNFIGSVPFEVYSFVCASGAHGCLEEDVVHGLEPCFHGYKHYSKHEQILRFTLKRLSEEDMLLTSGSKIKCETRYWKSPDVAFCDISIRGDIPEF